MLTDPINWPAIYILFGTLALLTIIVAVRRAREDMRELQRFEQLIREHTEHMEQFVGLEVPTRTIPAYTPVEPERPLQSVHGECQTPTMVTIWPVGGERKREGLMDFGDHFQN